MQKLAPIKPYFKKELRNLYGDGGRPISQTTFRTWLSKIPGLKDYVMDNGRKKYLRYLDTNTVKIIFEHLGHPDAK